MDEYNNKVGIPLEVYQHFDSGWQNLVLRIAITEPETEYKTEAEADGARGATAGSGGKIQS